MDKNNKFIKKAKAKHGDKFIYTDVNYISSRQEVTIKCKIHGDFKMSPRLHLQNKHGCNKCASESISRSRSIVDKTLIESNLQKSGVILLENVTSYSNKYQCLCKCGNTFKSTLSNLNNGSNCKECGITKSSMNNNISFDDFKKRALHIHGETLEYRNYINLTNPLEIKCPKHGWYSQMAYNHLRQYRCKKCSNTTPILEKEVYDFIDSFITCKENNRSILDGEELDIFIPTMNLAIEFNGLYWHSSKFKSKNYHLSKTNKCENKDIKLIHVFEDEWLFKKDIVQSRLKNILGFSENKIYARKTQIKEVETKEAMSFLEKNHIQGKTGAKVKLGLYFKNDLVALMTFGGLRKNLGQHSKEGHFELLRFCNKLDTTVVGGASKLFKHFVKYYSPIEILSYADRRWSTGNLYEKLGFSFIKDTEPNYFYVINSKRENRYKYRKSELVKQGFDNTKSEREIMENRKINRIYDCGNKKYLYICNK